MARIGPNWVICGDGAELRRMWGVRSAWQRAPWYRGLRINPYKDNAFSTLDDQVHEKLRAKLAPGYGGKDVDNLHQLIDEQVASFVSLIERKYLSTKTEFKPVDLARKVQYFTLDVISSLAFGKEFGFLAADKDMFGYIKTTESTLTTLLVVALVPWLLSILQSPRLKWLIPDARKMVGIGTVMDLAEAAVAERYGDKPVVKRDMLGSFVAHGLSKEEAEGETVVQIIAGSDTSATAIRSTLLFVMTSPLVYGRLQAEIDAGIRDGRISAPITDAEARNLPYLQAVIREGLRMWPPATAVLPKISDKDQVVCGVRIPAGTNVAWSTWSIMRNKETFGDDADLFRPERWFDIPADRQRLMEQTVMMEFASGSRWECLGKTVAQIELNKTFVELLRRFDFTLLDPANPWNSFNAAVFIQSDMNVVVTRRSPQQ
ncbi:hypothetical protein NEMBOFW57_007902 [Staphylotrichum longicolle]|uniref:Cytochrome P450 n=1 Tax=Staphylotrichum longicolle TaxID=669026 RepID=A0AAD4EVA7_9PEZI|nr:hypothetical protein NEMBOFW57_007902 [Staphylotrichum longicolle]